MGPCCHSADREYARKIAELQKSYEEERQMGVRRPEAR